MKTSVERNLAAGSFLTCSLEFRDDAGNLLASVEKRSSCSHNIAWVRQRKPPSFLTLCPQAQGQAEAITGMGKSEPTSTMWPYCLTSLEERSS